MPKSSSNNSTIGASLFLLIVGIILTPTISDMIDTPKIVMNAQYDEQIVPKLIVFNTDEEPTSTLSIKLLNSGDSGTIQDLIIWTIILHPVLKNGL